MVAPRLDNLTSQQLGSLTVAEMLARLTERAGPRSSREQFTPGVRVPRKETFLLSAIVAGGVAGVEVSAGGTQVLLSAASHAASRLEIQFDLGASENEWYPLVPSSSTRPPQGSSFRRFRVRAQQGVSVPSLAVPVYLLIAGDEFDQLEDRGRFAQVSPSGSMQTVFYLTTLAGSEVPAIGTDEGAIAIGGWTGAAYARARIVSAAADGVSGAAATALDTFARCAGWDPDTSTWAMLRAINAPHTGDTNSTTYGLVTNARAQLWNGATFDQVRGVTPADGLSATAGTLDVFARAASWSGSSWQRIRSVLPSAVYASTPATQSLATHGTVALKHATDQDFDVLEGGPGTAGDGSTASTAVLAARVVEAIPLTSPSGNYAVTAASVEVRAANVKRKAFVCWNEGPDNVYVAFGEAATTGGGAGTKLAAGMGLTYTGYPNVRAIRDGAAATLWWHEELHGF